MKNKHHPFCNYFMKPRLGCKLCDKLYEKYPIDNNKIGSEVDKIMNKYFTDVKKIEK